MKRRKAMLLVLFLLLALRMAPAMKTEQVEFGRDGAYDGHVTISRDVSGNMLFKDDSLTSPISLATIAQGVRNHGELTGLGNDDHTQYLNTSRHSAVHTAAFNNSLPIGPDVMNNTTIGQHVQDSDIHLSRSLGEMIVGPWKFDVMQEFRDNIKLSQHGLPGKMYIYFEDGESDAYLRWDKLYNRFEFNRMLYAPEANFDTATATTLRIGEDLYGNRPDFPPSGRISNFVSIEGIASENLLDKSADEDISGKWDFLNDVYIDGDLVTSGSITSLGGIKGLSKENVITVAKKGGDYDTIQAAVNAASEGTTILIYPGTYEEKVTINKSKIALVGITPAGNELAYGNNTGVIITYASSGVGIDLMTMLIASGGSSALSGIVLSNLTIINTSSQGTAQTALDIGRGDDNGTAHEVLIKNCYLYGQQDTVWVSNSGNVIFDNCYIYGTNDTLSIRYYCQLYRSYVECGQEGHSIIWLGNNYVASTKVYAFNCTFKSPTVSNMNGLINIGNNNYIPDIYLYHCSYINANSNTCLFNPYNKNVNVYIFKTNGNFVNQYATITHIAENVGNFNSLQIGGTEVISSARVANPVSLNIGGTERIDSSGNIKGATLLSGGNTVADASGGLASYTTLWKDWAAVAKAGPTWIFNNVTMEPQGWTPGLNGESPAFYNYLRTIHDADIVYFPIDYEAGTILTRLRVKWQAEGNGDGIKVRLVKRNENGTDTAWSVVGAQQTYTDAGTPYDVTVSTYDFADETMAANYSYSIEIESEVASTGSRLYAVGIESSKRVY